MLGVTCPDHSTFLVKHVIVNLLFQGECFLPGTARPGLEVPNPYIQEPITTLPVTTVTTSMVYTTLDGALYLFAATTDGSLLQVRRAVEQE